MTRWSCTRKHKHNDQQEQLSNRSVRTDSTQSIGLTRIYTLLCMLQPHKGLLWFRRDRLLFAELQMQSLQKRKKRKITEWMQSRCRAGDSQ
ncbi:hypothetical protein CDAR_484421 [Caerostris darwini]|uniref:Uncharacterized protein n=1 Tax=Caerostris darwini TaxID=1538125 RepID=A0AAV4TID2_9ARAC|nr:hypothetical protein CDAR_484421 [Caerostris darwini]